LTNLDITVRLLFDILTYLTDPYLVDMFTFGKTIDPIYHITIPTSTTSISIVDISDHVVLLLEYSWEQL